jgi:DNA segregation ATPase FtsK/SpoIIIE-like protein
MTNSIGTAEGGKGVKHEVVGVVLLALGAYSAVCLMSGISGSKLGGVAGEYFAELLFYSFGFSSYIIPLFLTITAFKLLLRRILVISVTAPIGLAVLLFASAALLWAVSSGSGAGGAAGSFLGSHLAGLTGAAGAAIILMAIVLITLIAITGVRLRRKNTPSEMTPSGDAFKEKKDTDGKEY